MAIAVPVARVRVAYVVWTLVASAVLTQIAYPLMPQAWRTEVTVASVVVFFVAAVADAARVHGLAGAAVLIGVAGGGGLVAEAVGVATGSPFGHYAYTGTLGPELLGVPVVVPLAWVMMAWPALVVARTLVARGPAVAAVGARGAHRVGRVPRPADGGRRALDLVRHRAGPAADTGHPTDQLHRLVTGVGGHHGDP